MSRWSVTGVPYQSPEVVLLYKSRQLRPQDEVDFANALPSLTRDQLSWLVDSIRPSIPDHSWLPAIKAAAARVAQRGMPD